MTRDASQDPREQGSSTTDCQLSAADQTRTFCCSLSPLG